jgi:hypothetical protein
LILYLSSIKKSKEYEINYKNNVLEILSNTLQAYIHRICTNIKDFGGLYIQRERERVGRKIMRKRGSEHLRSSNQYNKKPCKPYFLANIMHR